MIITTNQMEMDALAMVAALLMILFSLRYIITTLNRGPNHKKLPEPTNGWPVIGHLPVLAGPELPHRALAALADKYGPIFGLRIGLRHRAVVVSSPEIAKELFTVKDTAVLSRPALASFKHLTYNFALSGMGPHGAYWRQMRKIQAEGLLSNSRLELHRRLRESEVRKSVKDLHIKMMMTMMVEDGGGGPRLEVELKRWAWKIYTDPSVWINPMEFKPERFLTTNRDIDVKGQNFELIPFGSGRRSCPGMNLGLQMVKLILANFLHAFEISSPGNKPVDMTESFKTPNMKALPLDVVISPRLSPDTYA